MNDSEKIKKIKYLFKQQIDWYNTYKDDPDYVYDELWNTFGLCKRGDWVDFIKLLLNKDDK
jgi:hypothetical protein